MFALGSTQRSTWARCTQHIPSKCSCCFRGCFPSCWTQKSNSPGLGQGCVGALSFAWRVIKVRLFVKGLWIHLRNAASRTGLQWDMIHPGCMSVQPHGFHWVFACWYGTVMWFLCSTGTVVWTLPGKRSVKRPWNVPEHLFLSQEAAQWGFLLWEITGVRKVGVYWMSLVLLIGASCYGAGKAPQCLQCGCLKEVIASSLSVLLISEDWWRSLGVSKPELPVEDDKIHPIIKTTFLQVCCKMYVCPFLLHGKPGVEKE